MSEIDLLPPLLNNVFAEYLQTLGRGIRKSNNIRIRLKRTQKHLISGIIYIDTIYLSDHVLISTDYKKRDGNFIRGEARITREVLEYLFDGDSNKALQAAWVDLLRKMKITIEKEGEW